MRMDGEKIFLVCPYERLGLVPSDDCNPPG
jgi:hypothetical protein